MSRVFLALGIMLGGTGPRWPFPATAGSTIPVGVWAKDAGCIGRGGWLGRAGEEPGKEAGVEEASRPGMLAGLAE